MQKHSKLIKKISQIKHLFSVFTLRFRVFIKSLFRSVFLIGKISIFSSILAVCVLEKMLGYTSERMWNTFLIRNIRTNESFLE
ncbi:hypothetical protein IIC_04519 [Bacillus cereus VD021]|uniref:Uncharacterized protein n=1 Tax=Bacillus cereus VD021 TaxID=1053224 RepID=R8HDA0_BACCE|nr:hypothetical protein IIC_04519 [Bacillus cereus VD021]